MTRRALLLVPAALALAGCFVDDTPPPAPPTTTIEGDLAIEIRDGAHVKLTIAGSDLTAEVALTRGFGFAPPSLSGTGRVEAFGEAGTTLYTARFDAPAIYDGPCGGKDVSLALSLHRRREDARVGGSLVAYCGKGVWHGVPAKVLRVSGELPLPSGQ
jgi:hypothetical protein